MYERNPERSKQMILTAAELAFAEKGFFGARIDEIAAQAQINKRMIYAYYGNKEDLYKQVLFQVYGRMEEVEQALVTQKYTGEALIRAIIGAYFDFLQNNPTFVSILMWENLNKGQYLQEMDNRCIERDTIRHFVGEIEQGKAEGVFRQDVDAWHTVLSLITTCFANFSNQYTLSKLFGRDLTEGALIEERKKHTADMMVSYLCCQNKGGYYENN